ncbi:MAG TPA: hypothetical protein VNM40_03070 [Candidatus Paceibacterota bacterium]|nr:hypothetical protein [Candidatus Paceibacterota bacterium]
MLLIAALMPWSTHAIAALKLSSLDYQFKVDGTLRETGSMNESSSPYWWLNSGGALILDNGIGMTYQGTVPTIDRWRGLYANNNPTDTDNGTHPQNLFRLVSRSTWENVRAEASYKITRDNFSSSPNRNASNGLLLMSRYKDGNTLYYAGVRVDGTAVIKKKHNGTYTTLAQKKLYAGSYSDGGTTNLLPHGSWLSLRSETVTNGDGSVTVRLYVKNPGESSFSKVLEARDSSNPITGSGHIGIRTDFMDVQFDNVKATKI